MGRKYRLRVVVWLCEIRVGRVGSIYDIKMEDLKLGNRFELRVSG